MIFRKANIEDIKQILEVRNSVNENVLSSPDLVTEKECVEYITSRGKGWICVIDHKIVGFSIVDLKEHNVWALFLRPEFERKGIGKQLHNIMLDWYFGQTQTTIWLGTDPNTRAEGFYRKLGWKQVGIRESGEIKFEMTH